MSATVQLSTGDVSVLLASLQVLRESGDQRYTTEEYDALEAKLGALGSEAFTHEHQSAADRA